MTKLLIIEDDLAILKSLTYLFETKGFKVESAKDLTEAVNHLNYPDVIILDVTLPDGNGFDFYRKHIDKLGIPTLFLTAKDQEEDIVEGLETGADDYLTKPFFNKELIARVNRIIKKHEKRNTLSKNGVTFDLDRMEVKEDGRIIEFTNTEIKILEVLFRNMDRVITRDHLADCIVDWTGNFVNDNTITVYMNRIRKKFSENIIKTVKGIGYRIDSE